jgi:hypothetical protein
MRRVRETAISVGKATSITYSERVSVALVIQHAMRVRRIRLSFFSTIFFHVHKNGAIFGENLPSIRCFLFSLQFCLKYFSLQE